MRWALSLFLMTTALSHSPSRRRSLAWTASRSPVPSENTSAEGSTAASAGSSKELTAAEEEEVAKLDAAIEDIERRAKAKSGSSSISSGLELRRPRESRAWAN